MKVILTIDIRGTGRKGDIIEVKPGFAMNFLLPQKKAVLATATAVEAAKKAQEKRVIGAQEAKENAKKYGARVKGLSLVFKRKVADTGHLYGSVSEGDIAEAIKAEAKIDLDKKQIKMDEHIKTLGKHWIAVHLSDDVEIKLEVEVVAE